MKKILFASTALIATASVAAAEAELTTGGFARFGLEYRDGAAQENRLEQRFRLTFTATTETDAGVKFQGRIRIQSDDAGDNTANGAGPGAAGFAVSTGGLRVDVGSVSDALDSGDTVNYYGYGVGLTSFLEHNQSFNTGFVAGGFGNGADTQKVKVRYSAGDFTGNASYEPQNGGSDEVFQIGAGYSFGPGSVGFVYGDNQTDNNDFWVIGADATFGSVSVAAIVGEGNGGDTSWGLSGKYKISAATSVSAVISGGGADSVTNNAGAAVSSTTAVGVGFVHSLGGGVSLRGGVGRTVADDTNADFGVRFNF